MPWRDTDIVDERRRFVVLAMQKKQSFSSLCKSSRVARSTGYKWLARYREAESLNALGDRSRRPLHSPNRTDPHVEQLVVDYRREYGWGALKIRELLRRDGFELGTMTVHRILKRHGLISKEKSHSPATTRFERAHPNELWQMDFKGEYRIDSGWCYPFVLIDDHSRFLTCLSALESQKSDGVMAQLVDAFQQFGVPRAVLTDRGTPWWNNQGFHGLTRVSLFLIKQGVQLILGRVRHPQTKGKVERANRTLDDWLQHKGPEPNLASYGDHCFEFREVYNHVRPHQALGMAVPASLYQESTRKYDPNPAPWSYPSGSRVIKLDSGGSLYLNGRRYFVSEVLRDEWVAQVNFEDKILITYRDTHVREINCRTGASHAIVDHQTSGRYPQGLN